MVPSPTPKRVSAALRDRYNRRGASISDQSVREEILRRLSEPLTLVPERSSDARLQDGRAVRVDARLNNPMVTFISGRTKDRRTPEISEVASQRI